MTQVNHYEFDGEKYKQASKHQKEWGNKLISGLKLIGSETILDLGCGDGVLTEQLAELVPGGKVIGIDASLGMIETAKRIERENLTFLHTDINTMVFEDQFDVIFSNAALHWVKNHNRLLKASFAALKKGGVLSWNFAGEGTCVNFINTAKAFIVSEPYKEYFSGFEWPWFMPAKAEYEALTARIGFKTVTIDFENKDRYFANADEIVKWIDQPTIVPFLERIPDAKKSDFRDELVERMIERTLQPDGRCFETFKRINVKATK